MDCYLVITPDKREYFSFGDDEYKAIKQVYDKRIKQGIVETIDNYKVASWYEVKKYNDEYLE